MSLEEQNLAQVLDYLKHLNPEGSEAEKYLADLASRQVMECIMKIREERRNSRRTRPQPQWMGSEGRQNARKKETKKQRPIKIPENLQQIFEVEVQVAVRPKEVVSTVELPDH